MKLSKTLSALILLGLAATANAQTSATASTSEGGTSYVHTAQAPASQNAQGGMPGNQGGPGMGQGGGQRKGPPPEAIEACKGKSAGATCSFTGRNGETLTGTCFAPPAGGQGSPEGQASTNQAGSSGAQGSRPAACRPDRGGPNGMPPNNQPGQQPGQQRGPNAMPGGQG